jgi:SWI/SNF-related matrix-associated actin-dependent regulator 1 of chromatin subfamily A
MGEFKAVLKSMMLRRKSENVLTELPPLWWQDSLIEVQGWDDMKHIEDPAEKDAVELILQSAVTQDEPAVPLEKIAPHMASIRRLTALAKAKPIADQLSAELKDKAYDKVVVFAYHRAALETLKEELAAFNPAYVVGGMFAGDRQEEIDRFQTDPECRVFIGQITACSTAITLTAANQVVFAEMDWVPAVNAQASKRCHRIGQSKPVVVRSFALANSVDEIVARTLGKKARMISEVLD